MPELFPAFLKLAGRRCLVVGAGDIAVQKIPGLIAAGADVTVVAPRANDTVRRWAADGALRWFERKFAPEDLANVFLVVSATADRTVNADVFRHAESAGILCNAVDEPEHCDFYYPAVVRRGDLQIAISTNGKSPALAQRLRAELERQFPEEYRAWVDWLGRIRTRLYRRPMDSHRRKEYLHGLAAECRYRRFAAKSRLKENA